MSRWRCFAILLSTVFTVSCDRYMPSGFWLSYRGEEIVEKVSDQGPWGGNRSLLWKSNGNHRFNSNDVLQYATKNSWQLVDSVSTSPKTTDYGLPKWIKGNIKAFKFKTDWTVVEPGSDATRLAYGYLVFNETKTQMAVYHKWGE